METMDIVRYAVAAVIPMLIGFIWYNPKLFGNAWMKSINMTEEDMQGANMPLIFGISFLLSMVLAYFLDRSVSLHIHFGSDDVHFVHGLYHGARSALIVGIPVLVTNSLFERRNFANIAINGGYWILTFALMSGLLFAWN